MPIIDPPTIESNTATQNVEEQIRDKIIHVLSVYPVISHSMLQIGIGTALSPSMWRPILNKLVDDGVIEIDHLFLPSSSGRQQTYMQLRLKGTTYTLLKP